MWGWAIDRNSSGSTPGVDSVVLYLDGPPGTGALLGTATYGLGRSDVGGYFGDARWNNSGWQFAWSVGGLIWGNHTIYTALHSSVSGATTSLSQTVLYVPPPPDPAPPSPPASYTVPSGAISVSDGAGLLSALAMTTPQDIVLASGVYDNAAPFENPFGHRIYSATLGGAVFNAGLIMGGNSGPGGGLVQGVAFDVNDPSKAFLNSIVHVWGTGQGTRILDSTFNGNNAIGHAILARQPEGLVVRRVRVRNFTVNGITVDANVQNLAVATPALLEDLDVANGHRPARADPELRVDRSLDGDGSDGIPARRSGHRRLRGRRIHRALHDQLDLPAHAHRCEHLDRRRLRMGEPIVGLAARVHR
ncbi:MAG: hypothetical protein AUH85_05440 [Chloroflexi bacterium 13_1_40CM_4_68_4]|nr:MAG: hypothetical protein AUH85_05440 [Chloroflexi bacterium 13_1_40CM_4_68_4]